MSSVEFENWERIIRCDVEICCGYVVVSGDFNLFGMDFVNYVNVT